ncbi:MAG: lysophospholipase [Kosmotoga sp.]|uniref:alpha/beta fold hydrolase n=1 Tax=Kosmotoga sp. TaxID=1955248 RepID=UPI0025BE227C|nr:alpha/beta fold hydrolase [Kosmotoga sp.]MCD6159779.1 lysophospholipase [Kosmotoga sp.]
MFIRKWTTSSNVKGKIIIVHGLGEHSGRYEELASFLSKRGFVVYATDNEGHGVDPVPYGAAKKLSNSIKRIEALANMAKNEPPDVPFFLMGHSLGGLISIRLLEQSPTLFKAAILSSPPLKSYRDDLKSLYHGFLALSYIVPFLRLSNRIDPSKISKNDKVNRFYTLEPTVHDRISIGFFIDLERQINLSWKDIGRIDCPILMTYGSEDEVVSTASIEDFYNALSVKKKIKCFEGSKHEPYRDLDVKEKYFSTILDFLISWL